MATSGGRRESPEILVCGAIKVGEGDSASHENIDVHDRSAGCGSAASHDGRTAAAPMAPATGAGQFTTDTQARALYPSDTVVWVNTKSNIYHFAGKRDYGNTKQGAYMCEADAKAAGDRAAKNEKHP
jgi:hypothetical protein